MTRFGDSHKRARGEGRREEQAKTPIQLQDLPFLRDVLMGYEDKPGVFVKGLTLTMWYADGRLKFSINDKVNNLVGFAVVKGDLPLGESIELALVGEEIEWREKEDRR